MSNNARPHSELSNALEPTARPSVQSIASRSRALSNVTSSSAVNATLFKGPAHKHAHHLHSIPPREKSTRTLIIDHLLWVHARTRFAQARCELGMTDRTGGSSSPHYAHRERPENYDEEDEVDSDGEDASELKARPSIPETTNNDRDDRPQDLSLAKVLRLRAEGVEKVVTSMLDQPPPVHPIHDDDFSTPPTSPTFPATSPHKLPNGVRLRLALGTIINDLFARQAPRQPHHNHTDPPPSLEDVHPELPATLLQLSCVSPVSPTTPRSHSYGSFIPNVPQPTEHVAQQYNAGVNYHSANSPPSLRCPRHLHNGCSVCVSAQSPVGKKNRGGTAGGKNGITGFQDECGVGSGLSMPGPNGSVLRRRFSISSPSPTSTQTRLSEFIPRFLRLSALVLNELVDEGNGGSEEGLEPTRMWYLLLAGLLTRAVLEGYLTSGWRGLGAVQCLMSVGRNRLEPFDTIRTMGEGNKEEQLGAEELFEDFEPDETPALHDAISVLFPSLRTGRMSAAEGEYVEEMRIRLQKFYDIPNTSSTPDLSTHLEDLAWYYPAEPVERAAVRFCEAIAKWRGKPELETYKSRPITIESLVHTSPQQQSRSQQNMKRRERRPPIEAYFQRPAVLSNSWGTGQKRGRVGEIVDYPHAKRVHTAL